LRSIKIEAPTVVNVPVSVLRKNCPPLARNVARQKIGNPIDIVYGGVLVTAMLLAATMIVGDVVAPISKSISKVVGVPVFAVIGNCNRKL